jgi:vancomycin resistance protein VanJ
VRPSNVNVSPFRQSCSRWWRLITGLWCAGLLGLALLLHTVGQAHYLLAPFAYLPRVWPGVALLALAVPGWWWGRRRMALLLATGVVYLVALLEWRLPAPRPPPDPARPELRVAFANRGDQDVPAWERWLARVKPDVVGLTDIGRMPTLQVRTASVGGLPFLMRLGEHALASRFPFRGSEVVRSGMPPDAPGRARYLPAARFEVDAPGGAMAVYVVHLRSPRDALGKYGQWKFWQWTWRGVPPGVLPSVTLDHYWEEQEATLAALLGRMRQETIPTVVLGDWNLPDFGPRYRELTRTFQDAHRVAGRGYGYTFPGDLQHGAAGGKPWLRLDYLLADREWQVLEFATQDDPGTSQHRGLQALMRRP